MFREWKCHTLYKNSILNLNKNSCWSNEFQLNRPSFIVVSPGAVTDGQIMYCNCHQAFNIMRILVSTNIFVFGASRVGAAPTTSSFAT